MTAILLENNATGIAQAAQLLRAGNLVAFPTETVYGLGADAGNDTAVAKIFEAKGRPQFNPLIVHVADLESAREYAEFPDPALQLAQAFWPGPLTLVLPRRAGARISDLCTAGLPTIALRVPEHPAARTFIRAFGGGIAAPSANPSGKVSPTRAEHVQEGLGGRVAAILDAGNCQVGVESTIVGFEGEAALLLRPGGLPVEDIEACLSRPLAQYTGAGVTAPGQLTSHYAPDAPMRLGVTAPEAREAYLGFGDSASHPCGLNLSPSADLTEAAANLFAYMRRIDRMAQDAGCTRIAVAPIPETGLGRAINDRLRRAAAPRET